MRRSDVIAALIVYAVLLCAAWIFAAHTSMAASLGPAFPTVFLSLALVLAPLLWFGFSGADWLRARLRSRTARVATASYFVLPYLLSSLSMGAFDWHIAVALLFLSVGLTVLFELRRAGESSLGWQDLVILAALAVPIIFNLFRRGWPAGGFPKLLLADLALYLYLLVRRLPRVGYDFRPQKCDLAIGLREWLFFAPIAIGLGFALGFLHWHPGAPRPLELVGGLAFTLVFIAVPEELFFRGLLLNLLETRLPRLPALLVSAVIFGLSHFNKGAAFNWRYVLLAGLAGIFYGRAWRYRDRVLTSAITHTLVDVTWSRWLR